MSGIHRGTGVQVPDELLVGVAPLALGRQSAERPDGDRQRESQEQETGGEPEAAACDAPYFLPPFFSFPLPFDFGRAAGGAGGGTVGAFFACPGGRTLWWSLECPSALAFPWPCVRGAGETAAGSNARL